MPRPASLPGGIAYSKRNSSFLTPSMKAFHSSALNESPAEPALLESRIKTRSPSLATSMQLPPLQLLALRHSGLSVELGIPCSSVTVSRSHGR